ncbi:MAG: 30S ribosomal protein S18 [Patescibacteria group bacterium]
MQTKLRPVAVNCPFCRGRSDPDYKNPGELTKYMTDRAKIVPKSRSGLCAKHQRRLTVSIKRARHLALLPFSGGL